MKNENAHIVVLNCSAKIATSSKASFYMEFFSSCFEGTVKTQPNDDFNASSDSSYTCPVWKTMGLPLANIKPIVTEEGYLEQQHVLIMLKSQEGDEPYGESGKGVSLLWRGELGRKGVSLMVSQGGK